MKIVAYVQYFQVSLATPKCGAWWLLRKQCYAFKTCSYLRVGCGKAFEMSLTRKDLLRCFQACCCKHFLFVPTWNKQEYLVPCLLMCGLSGLYPLMTTLSMSKDLTHVKTCISLLVSSANRAANAERCLMLPSVVWLSQWSVTIHIYEVTIPEGVHLAAAGRVIRSQSCVLLPLDLLNSLFRKVMRKNGCQRHITDLDTSRASLSRMLDVPAKFVRFVLSKVICWLKCDLCHYSLLLRIHIQLFSDL